MQGDPKIIEYLNKALTNELTAINQYWLHYRVLNDWGVTTLAEYERNLIRERTIAGLKAARARGRKGGRKPVLGPKEKREIEALLLDPKITVKDVAERYGVSRNTIYQHIDVKAINEAMNKKRIQQIMEEESHG